MSSRWPIIRSSFFNAAQRLLVGKAVEFVIHCRDPNRRSLSLFLARCGSAELPLVVSELVCLTAAVTSSLSRPPGFRAAAARLACWEVWRAAMIKASLPKAW